MQNASGTLSKRPVVLPCREGAHLNERPLERREKPHPMTHEGQSSVHRVVFVPILVVKMVAHGEERPLVVILVEAHRVDVDLARASVDRDSLVRSHHIPVQVVLYAVCLLSICDAFDHDYRVCIHLPHHNYRVVAVVKFAGEGVQRGMLPREVLPAMVLHHAVLMRLDPPTHL